MFPRYCDKVSQWSVNILECEGQHTRKISISRSRGDCLGLPFCLMLEDVLKVVVVLYSLRMAGTQLYLQSTRLIYFLKAAHTKWVLVVPQWLL